VTPATEAETCGKPEVCMLFGNKNLVYPEKKNCRRRNKMIQLKTLLTTG
jgi:hypothetical protein